MKRAFLSLAMIALFCLSAFGVALAQQTSDVYMEEQVNSPGKDASQPFTGIIKSWVSGKKLKQELPGTKQSIVFRADLGKVYLLNPAQKIYIEVPIDQMRAGAQKSLDMYKDESGKIPDTIYKKTGKTKKVGKWNTYEVELPVEHPSPGAETRTTMWVSKETGFDHEFLVRIFKITMGEKISPELQKLFDRMTALDGYPVQTVKVTTYNNETYTETSTVLKIERKEKIDQSIFEVPKDFTKAKPPSSPPVTP